MKRFARISLAACVVGLFAGPTACSHDEVVAPPVGPTVPARRAAMSFVHCLETDGGQCVRPSEKQGAWDAFAFLGWLAHGSPTSILQALPRELGHHKDARSVSARFVNKSTRLREAVRGSECRDDTAKSIGELIPTMRARVEQRMTAMGLWSPDLQAIVDGLTHEANAGLADAYLVHMRCFDDPYHLWVATSTSEERYLVVGVMTRLPEYLGGTAPDREVVEGRLHGKNLGSVMRAGAIREGTVDSEWIPLPVEEF
jgi:hypothetical protein